MHPNLFRMNCEIGRSSNEEYSGCLCCYQNPLASCAVPECLSLSRSGFTPAQGAPGLILGRMNSACVLQQQWRYSVNKHLLAFPDGYQAGRGTPGCSCMRFSPSEFKQTGQAYTVWFCTQIFCANVTYYFERWSVGWIFVCSMFTDRVNPVSSAFSGAAGAYCTILLWMCCKKDIFPSPFRQEVPL